MSDKIRSYAELQELIRVSLRIQHPEWIDPNGDSPVCDSYEARFAELLGYEVTARFDERGISTSDIKPPSNLSSADELLTKAKQIHLI
jgi:hypothetical protein